MTPGGDTEDPLLTTEQPLSPGTHARGMTMRRSQPARARWNHFHGQETTRDPWEPGGQERPGAGTGTLMSSQHTGLTAYPLSLGVVNSELVTEEIVHGDLLLLRQAVVFH